MYVNWIVTCSLGRNPQRWIIRPWLVTGSPLRRITGSRPSQVSTALKVLPNGRITLSMDLAGTITNHAAFVAPTRKGKNGGGGGLLVDWPACGSYLRWSCRDLVGVVAAMGLPETAKPRPDDPPAPHHPFTRFRGWGQPPARAARWT
jgi:hypothetical protein